MFDYFDWASERIQRKKDIVLMLCERNEYVSPQVRKYFSDDEDFAEAILHNSSRRDEWLECLSSRFRDDREYVKRWCETSGGGLKYASDRLKDDTELCIAAVKNYRYAIWHVSDRLKNDLEFCSIVLESGVRLDDLGEAARDDYQIVHRSVELFGYNLEHASERLKNDSVIVFTALNGHFPFTIAYRCDDISGSLELNIYQYIGSELKQDPDFAKTVCSCFLKTPIGKKHPADELMKEPMEVYRILEQEGKRLEEWDMHRWDDKSAEGIQGIDFTDVLKQLKEKFD